MTMRVFLGLLLLIGMQAVVAQEYTDADPSYGLMKASYGGGVGIGQPALGQTSTVDSSDPVSPMWTGDQDDGIIGTPMFDSWSNNNSITIELVGSEAHIVVFVDANDDGSFSSNETYVYTPNIMVPPGTYVLDGISIHATQDFSRNGANKVAVRVTAQDNIGGWPFTNPNNGFYFGEVEDWLIDVEPAKFAVYAEQLRDATEGTAYDATIGAINGAPPYTWTHTGGTLPAGVTLAQSGNNFLLSGSPGTGTGTGYQEYSFDVQVQDSTGQIANRTLVLPVWPPAVAAPFSDDFSTATGWKLGGTWDRTPAALFQGTAVNHLGVGATEPAEDHSPTTDNMVLSDTPGAEIPDILMKSMYATSPKIDCSTLTDVQLRFRRWLSTGWVDYMKIEASANGRDWVEVWKPDIVPGWYPPQQIAVCDSGWTLQTVDISAVAAGADKVQVRFALGPVNSAYKVTSVPFDYAGWVLDGVEIVETPQAGPATVSNLAIQNAGVFTYQGGNTYPVAYPGTAHPWTAQVDNNGATDLNISEIEVGVHYPAPPGSSQSYIMIHDANNGWWDLGDWSLDPQSPVTVAAGATGVTINGTFDAVSPPAQFLMQPFTATLFVRGTDAGTGKSVEITTELEFIPYYSAQPGIYAYEYQAGGTPVDNGQSALPGSRRYFQNVPVGGSSNWENIVLKNTSGVDVDLAALGYPTITGADAGEFDIDYGSYDSFVGANGGTTWFSIKFRPTSPGLKTATVQFPHSATNTGTPFTFEIVGDTASNTPVMVVRENSLQGPPIAPTTGSLDLGQQDIGNGATQQVAIYIENTGGQTLNLGTPGLTGADAADFVLDSSLTALAIPAGGSTSFQLSFDPTATGVKTATVEWTHNDPALPPTFTFDVTGEGIISAPVISVLEGHAFGPTLQPGSPAAGPRQFGVQDVNAGPTPGATIVIRNDGWQDLNLGTPALNGANLNDFGLDLTGFVAVVPPQGTSTIVVYFDPVAKGMKDATIEFTHDDLNVVSPFTLGVAGIGYDPNGVSITSTQLDTGKVGEFYGPENLQAAGGTTPYAWSLEGGILPQGLAMSPGGVITGTPMGSYGVFSLQLKVTDALGGTDIRQLDLVLSPPAGHIEKAKGKASSSGCTTGSKQVVWAILLMLGMAGALRLRRA